jgi:outer membrane protein assembly factor BamB
MNAVDAQSTKQSSFDIPPEVAGHEAEWPLANHDYANTRAAVSSSINASNVANLAVAWTISLSDTAEWGGGTGNPIISDSIVYYQDLAANTFAINLETGKVIWRKEYYNQIFGPSAPGIGYGKLFVISRIDRYSALDIKTGEELWQFSTGMRLPSGAFQPYVFGNRVYITTQAASSGHSQVTFHSYQGGSSGAVFLLDPETGKSTWSWQVVEEGFWGNPEINSGGGLWFPPAIDTENGTSFCHRENPLEI